MLCSFTQVEDYPGRQKRGYGNQCMNLTENQREQMKTVRVKFLKETQELRNELAELRVHQRSLMTVSNPDRKTILSNVDRMSAKKEELMKRKVDMQIEINSFLTDEQKLLRSSRSFGHFGREGHGKMAQERGKCHGQRMHGKKGKGVGQKGKRMNLHCGEAKGCNGMLKLTANQKEEMKELRIAHLREVQPMQNKMRELKAKQHSLLSAEKTSKKLLMANVEAMSDLQNQLMKQKVNHQLEVQKILTEDQRALWNARGHRKGNERVHHFGRRYR